MTEGIPSRCSYGTLPKYFGRCWILRVQRNFIRARSELVRDVVSFSLTTISAGRKPTPFLHRISHSKLGWNEGVPANSKGEHRIGDLAHLAHFSCPDPYLFESPTAIECAIRRTIGSGAGPIGY